MSYSMPMNKRWALNVCNNRPYEGGSFVEAIASAYLKADKDNALILDVAVNRLRIKYPEWDVEGPK